METNFDKTEPIRTKTGFENPWETWQGLPSIFSVMRWWLTPKERDNKIDIDKALPVMRPTFQPNSEALIATWLGHATVLLQIDHICILTDPIFSDRCSPIPFMGPRRIRPIPCTVGELPNIDVVLISHNHYDHLDLNTVKQLNSRFGNKLKWYVPFGLKSWFSNRGCENVAECNWWQECFLGDSEKSLKIVCLPSQHWSTRTSLDRNKSLWCSWAVKGLQDSFFFAGDTGYCPVFKSIGHYYGPFTLSAIPIGCYKPRWFMKNQHIDPSEAIKIHQDIGSQTSIGIHWGTYDMGSTEDFLEPKRELESQARNASLKAGSFVTLFHGESWTSSNNFTNEASDEDFD